MNRVVVKLATKLVKTAHQGAAKDPWTFALRRFYDRVDLVQWS